MSLLLMKLGCGILILTLTLLAGFYPFYKRAIEGSSFEFPIAEALASGVFLGAGLLHMLGDASHQWSKLGMHYPMASLLAGAMFLLLLFFEHVAREMYDKGHKEGESSCSHKATEQHYCAGTNNLVVLAVIMLSVHSFLAGSALGLSSTYLVSLMLLIAILAHKWAASMALAIQINKSNLSVRARITLFSVFAVMAPLGVFFGQHLLVSGVSSYVRPIYLSLAAGTFIYLGTLHGLKQSVMVDKCCDIKRFNFVLAGFGVMALVALWT